MTDELTDLEGQTPVEHALAGGEPQRVGWFRFYFTDERWEWSPQVERMHGYDPGTVHPTTELVLSHKHPDDYGQVAATLDEIRRTSGAFSTRHGFELLRWRSQETNTKLRALAEQIAKDFLQVSYDEVLPARAVYDRLLLTAHMRVGS